MESQSPSHVVRQLFEAINEEDVEAATQLIDPSYRGIDATRSALTVGKEKAGREIEAGLEAFSNASFSVLHTISEPPFVSVFWTLDAVHEGTFLHIPPTHLDVAVSGVGLFDVEEGRIVRAVHLWDFAGLLRNLGLLPDLPDAS